MSHLLHLAHANPNTDRLRRRVDRRLQPIRPSHRDELWYRDRLLAMVRVVEHVGADVIDDVRADWVRANDNGGPLVLVRAADASVPKLEGAIARAKQRVQSVVGISVEAAGGFTKLTLQTVDARLARSVHQSLGVDIAEYLRRRTDIASEVARARRANIELIESIPEKYFGQLDRLANEYWLSGTRWEELAKRIKKLGHSTRERAELIAQDQTSKLNAAFNRVRQTSIGIARYQWQTSEDERVRPAHRLMDGVMCQWNAPPLVEGEHVHPGEAIRCRCVAIPVFDLATGASGGVLSERYAEAA